jgi:hypothetical protein
MLSTMLTVWPAKPPVVSPPMVAKAVPVEPIRTQRTDTVDTWRNRWLPAALIPPAYLFDDEPAWIKAWRLDRMPATVRDSEGQPVRVIPVRTVEVRVESTADQGKPAVETGAAPPPARHVKRAALLHRDNVCARHGKRKVTYLKRGYKFWKCR